MGIRPAHHPMNKTVLLASIASALAGCATQPSPVDSSVTHATPEQFVPAENTDVLQRAYEQRVRQRADELYRTRQAPSLVEADKRAREELNHLYTPPVAPDSVSSQREARRKASSELDQKTLDAAADEVSRQRNP